MTKLENQLAEALLSRSLEMIHDAKVVERLIGCYSTLVFASKSATVIPLWETGPCCGEDIKEPGAEPVIDADKTTVTEFCKTVVETLAEPEKPTRTRRTKAQIESDNAAAAKVSALVDEAQDQVTTEDPALQTGTNAAAPEPEAEEIQIDDVEPAAPKITHGQVQEMFTRKLSTIAANKGDVSGFKERIRAALAEAGSPAGISKLPEANLAAFHAKLVNLV